MAVEAELAAWVRDRLAARSGCDRIDARFDALPAEASTRRFFRVRSAALGDSFIAMHSPPRSEDNPRFVRLARRLRRHGLGAPRIHGADLARGFVLMEDLGATDFAAAYAQGQVDAPLAAAIDALARLQTLPADGIPDYTAQRLRDELGIFAEHLARRLLGTAPPPCFADAAEALIDAAQSVPRAVVHRDYHCRNLIWRADGTVGIVDFQDALVGPSCYDIASLLRDCYHVFDEAAVARWRERFFVRAQVDCPAREFARAFDLVAMQRQLKAVGIFARLHLRGRDSHLADIVPVLRRIARLGAGYAATAALADWIADAVLPRAERLLPAA